MRQHLLLGSTAVFALVVGVAFAQDKPAGTAGDKAGKPAGNDQSYIQRYDKNKDGSLSRNELPADMRNGFKDLDKNSDGKLDTTELQDHAARMQACIQPVEVVTIWTIEAVDPVTKDELQAAYDQLRQVDKNNDGKIADDEIKAARDQAVTKRIDSMFQRLDANSDGKLTKEESQNHSGFTRADQNNDGSVTRDELKAAITQDAEAGGGTGAGTAPARDK